MLLRIVKPYPFTDSLLGRVIAGALKFEVDTSFATSASTAIENVAKDRRQEERSAAAYCRSQNDWQVVGR